MTTISRKAFCAYRDWATGSAHLDVSVVRCFAGTVRDEMGLIYDADPAKGWALAKKDGWRVVPVTVSAEISAARDQARKDRG